jgi:hypothetical protein
MGETVGFNITAWSDAPKPELDEDVRLTVVKHFLASAALTEAVVRDPHLTRRARGNLLQFAFTMIRHQYDAGSDGESMY